MKHKLLKIKDRRIVQKVLYGEDRKDYCLCITKSRTGYVVHYWSINPASCYYRKFLVKFSTFTPKSNDLHVPHPINGLQSLGHVIATLGVGKTLKLVKKHPQTVWV